MARRFPSPPLACADLLSHARRWMIGRSVHRGWIPPRQLATPAGCRKREAGCLDFNVSPVNRVGSLQDKLVSALSPVNHKGLYQGYRQDERERGKKDRPRDRARDF